MVLKELKKFIQYGFLAEARQLIDQADINDISYEEINDSIHELPLLIYCTLINNENSAYNLCISLIEKGYNVNLTDINGLCALNYAIIFDRAKLVELFLNTFDFDFFRLHDRYGNSILHYVFAKNNDIIISLFTNMYKKYYSWNEKFLSSVKNCDGLSVLDLYNYYIDALKLCDAENSKKTVSLKSRNDRSLTAVGNKRQPVNDESNQTSFSSFNKNFFRSSNPIFIIKNIKQMYNSKLTMKTIALLDKNGSNKSLMNQLKNANHNTDDSINDNFNNNKGFQMNHLYKLKEFNRIKSSINIPLQTNRHKTGSETFSLTSTLKTDLSKESEYLRRGPLLKRKGIYNCLSANPAIRKYDNWKHDVTTLLGDYAALTTPSYRNSFIPNRNLTNSIETTVTIYNDSIANSTIKPVKSTDETISSVNTARSGVIAGIRLKI
jgi:hypothetical protein